MNRRELLSGAALIASSRIVGAQMPMFQAPPPLVAAIKFPSAVLAAKVQQCPEWCWAASISAVFSFFGKSVDQVTIVSRKYRVPACWPSGTAAAIAQFLNTTWIDQKTNTPFQCRLTGAFDAMAHVGAINNAMIVNELSNQRPVVYCNTHHCMVICEVKYYPGPMPNIVEATVMDPWPKAQRFHSLCKPELYPAIFNQWGQRIGGGQMAFLGSVSIIG